MIIEGKPKVFISYSWSSDDIVIQLAERLMSQGVDVVLDKWDLKEGQNKYAFMERCVNDETIDRVLIVSDARYAEKANSRTDGVGDETVIISAEIYGNMKQEKFIPIVVEHDSAGRACLPTYIKSMIYIDLSDDEKYEAEYEKLLRNIYEKPLYKKPQLGKKPEWLIDEEQQNLFLLGDLCRQIRYSSSELKSKALVNRFLDEHINQLINIYDENCFTGELVFKQFQKTKPVRDCFLEFLDILDNISVDKGVLLSKTFETLYNKLTVINTFQPDSNSANEITLEVYKIYIWELFICCVAYFKYRSDYKTLNGILMNTYFVSTSVFGGMLKPADYTIFRHYSEAIEAEYKITTERMKCYTLVGDEICRNREKKPIFDSITLARADLYLYQVYKAFEFYPSEYCSYNYWFPALYIYAAQDNVDDWIRLKSRKYCTQLFELFGVHSLKELKERVSRCSSDKEMRYGNSWRRAKNILDYVEVDDIGVLS